MIIIVSISSIRTWHFQLIFIVVYSLSSVKCLKRKEDTVELAGKFAHGMGILGSVFLMCILPYWAGVVTSLKFKYSPKILPWEFLIFVRLRY